MLVLLHAGGEEDCPGDDALEGHQPHHQPQKDHGHGKDGPEDLEEQAGDLLGQGARRDGEHADGESETPPAHVEGKLAPGDAGQGEEQPHAPVAPDHQGTDDAEAVDDPPGFRAEVLRPGEHVRAHLAQLHEPETALAQRAEGQEDRHDDLARREAVDGEAVEVHDQDDHGQGEPGAPEDVRGDDGPDLVLRVGEDLGDDPARGGRDDGGHDGQEPRRRHLGQLALVDVHDDKGQPHARGDGDDDVDPPQRPGQGGGPGAPRRHAHKHHHVDDGGEAHGERPDEQGLHGVPDHGHEQAREEGVAQDRDEQENTKEADVETKDDDRQPVQPVAVVREVVEQDGRDPRAHGRGEPRGREVQHHPPPSVAVFRRKARLERVLAGLDDSILTFVVEGSRTRYLTVCIGS